MADELLDLCLADICRGDKSAAFMSDPRETVKPYRLTDETTQALLAADYQYLLARGAHPILTMYFARMNGVAPSDYIEIVRHKATGGTTR